MKQSRIHAVLGLVILVLAGIAYHQGGLQQSASGFSQGIRIMIRELPLLAAAFLTAGMLQALVKKDQIRHWLGEESGLSGILLGCLGGGLIPGGPYAYYPIAAALLKQGAGLGVLVAFVFAKNLWSISRLPLEIAILGTTITFRRYLVTFLIPPLMGLLAESLFGPLIKKIRRGTPQ